MEPTVTRRFWWRQRANLVLNWVFPNAEELCVLCGRPVVGAAAATEEKSNAKLNMCLFCAQDLSTCDATPTAQTLRLGGSGQLMTVHSSLVYDHLVRTMVRSWKYDGVIALTNWFAGHVASVIGQQSLDPTAGTLVVPVPSTRDRTQKRGYDHVRLLTNQISLLCHLHSAPALKRLQNGDGFTQSQTAKSAVERQRGLSQVYLHNKEVSVRGQRIFLVDDIVTTGATLSACAERLMHAGAASVECFVIARVL
ncbi:ComF family protein [Alicyclobacillus dauci]|uniref:Phosphoribosyltransferase family protein n=1 Tax=Alicyclobacillus dauci TaxID=1475485 RepID=A0ABY6Z496_9BACL|nr:phosphoribosyltransferase family protein [Alicyclobacillus dauci]WAH37681.1 phosphoribosyltransferase family protein [Alicyclobacillus dauci]